MNVFCNVDVAEIYCAFCSAHRMDSLYPDRARRLEKMAVHCAEMVGANDYRAGRHTPPELFLLEPRLCASWRFGHADAGIREACDELLEMKRQRSPAWLRLGQQAREDDHGRH